MSTMPVIGQSISFDRPNMRRATIIGIMTMTTSGTKIETAIAMMTIELMVRPSNKVHQLVKR
jgi:hypothetical protein